MAKLHKELALLLLNYSTKDKEEIGNKIVLALGGDPTKSVVGLPPRRGNSDGGIDGRIPIIIEIDIERRRGNATLYSEKIKETADAAFSVKLQNKEFDRNQVEAFIGDMRRERIFDGIIITVLPLSTDAEWTLNNYNEVGNVRLRHVLIEDLLANQVKLDFELANGQSFIENFIESIASFTN